MFNMVLYDLLYEFDDDDDGDEDDDHGVNDIYIHISIYHVYLHILDYTFYLACVRIYLFTI